MGSDWWSSTSIAETHSHYLDTNPGVIPQGSNYRGMGFAVRCVVRGGVKGDSAEGYNKINNWPLNFLRTGLYVRSEGHIYTRITFGYWWSAIGDSAANSRILYTAPAGVDPQVNSYRGSGFAVRWVVCGALRSITTTYNIPSSSAGSIQLRSAPLEFEYGGVYGTGGQLDNIGYGYNWSRTGYDANYAYYLYFDSSHVTPQGNAFRGQGHAVRCVAR